MPKDKVLFVKKYNTNPKFITNDIEILSEKYYVRINNVKTTNNLLIILTLVKEFLFLLFNIWRFKTIYIWFADYHSFLPILFSKIFKKKSIICAGGYECTYIPEINCGVFTKSTISKRVRNFCTAYSLRNCSLILPVDESLIENVNTYIYSDVNAKEPLRDGIKNFVTTPAKIETIYLGYDANVFCKKDSIQKKNSVISAGLIINNDEYRRKGFDLLVEAAKMMPETEFVLIGFNDEYYNKVSSMNIRNLTLYKIITYEKLTEEYSKAKVFAQISMFEGMPSTLCEAMMCECIPVGSNVNGIPGIIEDTGFIVYHKNSTDVVDILKKALSSSSELGQKARMRIINNFSLEQRRVKLLDAVENLLKN